MSSVSQFPPPHLISDGAGEEGEATEKAEEREGQKQGQSQEQDQGQAEQRQPLALPAPGQETTTGRLALDSKDEASRTVHFDSLGPMVVNTDGTLSRVHNWHTLTEAEQERTKRVLVKRNNDRLKKLQEKEQEREREREQK